MNPAPREYRLTLLLLDVLLAGLSFVFVARAGLRRLAAGIRPWRHHEN
jgi:hypothetical protein